MQVQVPARAEEACQIYDPTTKLIILRRSPKTSIWDSCGRYCIKKEIIIKKKKKFLSPDPGTTTNLPD
jgi:hypothetical protein